MKIFVLILYGFLVVRIGVEVMCYVVCFKGISNKFIYSIYVYYGRVFLGLVNIFWLFRF